MRPYLGKGLSELNVPALEPLVIDQLGMDNDAGAVRIKARFSDILAKGTSNYTIKEVRSDVKVSELATIWFESIKLMSIAPFVQKLRFDMRLTIPRVESRGKYEVIGNVLLLPVRSNGEFWAEFSEITAIIKVYGKEVKRDNNIFMHIDKLGLDFTMKNARFKVKDNVNAQNVLGECLMTKVNDVIYS